jgi:hypothetical protein
MNSLFDVTDNSQKEFPMDSNLELRIRNFDLSHDDYLMPVFEAISNSIQSIKDNHSHIFVFVGLTKGNFIP